MLPAFGNSQDLSDIEERLAKAPDDLSLLFARACTLDMLGRNDEARDAYIAVIRRDGTHVGALGNLGTLLYNAGYRSAARLTYREALKHNPRDHRSLVNLGNALLESNELVESRQLYERAIELDANSAQAHQGLSHVLGRLGEDVLAEEHRRRGFELMPVVVSYYRGAGMPVSVLLLSSAFRGNIPVDDPLDDGTFMIVKLFTEYYDPEFPLPPHDVIFNGIGDADRCHDALVAAQSLLEANGARAINAPANVLGTGRVAIAQRLQGIDGLIVPHIEEIDRSELDRVQRFPVLVRPPGYHTGEFFEMAQDRADLERIVATLPGERLLVIELLDARGRDGLYRKYRFLSIGGVLYPVHLARSSHWKVHYFSADQVRTPDAIAEETAFLTNPRAAIGERAMSAIEAAAARIDLEYFGIDFALDAKGNALLFEANATMRAVVPPADEPSMARRQASLAANAAFRNLVLRAVT
ncbi:MAG: tetratricopeptide repeat protein [Candidatus Aquilonibacter sp.]